MKKNIIVLLCIFLILFVLLFFIITQINKKDVNENILEVENKQNTINDGLKITPEEQENILKGNFGEINRIFKNGSITNTSATILLINRTNVMFPYSYWFVIEKKVNGEWKLLKFKEDISLDALGRYIMPNRSVELKLDWTKMYGKLKPGDYRLVLEDFSGENDYYYMEFYIN